MLPLALGLLTSTARGEHLACPGHSIDIERNVVGDVLALRAGGGPAVAPGSEVRKESAPSWEAKFTRNQLGLELERHMPALGWCQ